MADTATDQRTKDQSGLPSKIRERPAQRSVIAGLRHTTQLADDQLKP